MLFDLVPGHGRRNVRSFPCYLAELGGHKPGDRHGPRAQRFEQWGISRGPVADFSTLSYAILCLKFRFIDQRQRIYFRISEQAKCPGGIHLGVPRLCPFYSASAGAHQTMSFTFAALLSAGGLFCGMLLFFESTQQTRP